MIDPRAFRMTTPGELEALDRGEAPTRRILEHPTAIQACTEEAEAAVIRAQPMSGNCRPASASPADRTSW